MVRTYTAGFQVLLIEHDELVSSLQTAFSSSWDSVRVRTTVV